MSLNNLNQYKAPYLYLINYWIKEYDMEKANISVLCEQGAITEEQYQTLYHLPKQSRQVAVGKMMRDNPELIQLWKKGIVDARTAFLSSNSINDNEVLYIDNDSITVIEPRSNRIENTLETDFGRYIHFRIKNVYSSLYRLDPIDFLYYHDANREYYRLKYVDDQKLSTNHKNHFLEFLMTLAEEAEDNQGRVLNTLQMVKNTYCRYMGRELELDFYREFNQKSQFRLRSSGAYIYYSDVPPTSLDHVDISYNAKIMMTMYRYFMNEYFKERRHY